jgi:hypothetical protein
MTSPISAPLLPSWVTFELVSAATRTAVVAAWAALLALPAISLMLEVISCVAAETVETFWLTCLAETETLPAWVEVWRVLAERTPAVSVMRLEASLRVRMEEAQRPHDALELLHETVERFGDLSDLNPGSSPRSGG